jgi:hypothetical protein
MFRHFLTFLVFLAGVCAVYKLSCQRFSDWRIGCLRDCRVYPCNTNVALPVVTSAAPFLGGL